MKGQVSFLWLVLLVVNVVWSESNVCLWNRGSDPNVWLNGEYVYNGTYRDNPYYYLRVDDCSYGIHYYYLYYQTGQMRWHIHDTLGSAYNYAKCRTQLLDSPTQCGDQWRVGGVDDPTIVMTDECPLLPCQRILFSTAAGNHSCEGRFDILTHNTSSSSSSSDNTYYRMHPTLGKQYLYFNPSQFKWGCTGAVDLSTCFYNKIPFYGYSNADTTDNWPTDLRLGHSFTLMWYTDIIATLHCTQATESPTDSPTNSPIMQPSVAPTDTPTTTAPTNAPTIEIHTTAAQTEVVTTTTPLLTTAQTTTAVESTTRDVLSTLTANGYTTTSTFQSTEWDGQPNSGDDNGGGIDLWLIIAIVVITFVVICVVIAIVALCRWANQSIKTIEGIPLTDADTQTLV